MAVDLVVILFENGLSGILEPDADKNANRAATKFSTKKTDTFEDISILEKQVREVAAKGGSQIETFRFDKLLPDNSERNDKLDSLVNHLVDRKVDILYVIGGEGSMRAAHALQTRARLVFGENAAPSIVGIPKTMDNDILWVWQSFGFLSAVEKAREFIVNLHTEVSANPRLCVIQLFGSDSGFVVSHAALGAGAACCGALIPEVNFSLEKLGDYICEYLKNEDNRRHGSLVLAETAVPIDVDDFLDEPMLGVTLVERTAVREFMGSALLTNNDIAEGKRIEFIKTILDPDLNAKWLKRLQPLIDSSIITLMAWITNPNPPNPTDPKDPPNPISPKDSAKILDQCWLLILDALNKLIKKEELWGQLKDFVKGDRSINQKGPALLNTLETLKVVPSESLWTSPTLIESLRNLRGLMGLPYEAMLICRLIDPENKTERKHIVSDDGQKTLLVQLRKRLTETLNRTILEALLPEFIRLLSSSQSERRVFGQTPDELRMAGLKIVSNYLQNRIRTMGDQNNLKDPWKHYRVLINQPRHLIRSMDPSCHDVIFCGRLGKLAVDNAMGGYSGFMISQWLTEYVLVPLDLVVLGRKRVPPNGIFWKSVIASTGQWANLWWSESKAEVPCANVIRSGNN
jgi:6-phosphofructokinase